MIKTVVLMTSNNEEYLREHFDSLRLDTADEVLAVDDSSQDGTVEFLKEKGISVVRQDTPGRGMGVRLALKRAEGECLLFFTPDGTNDPEDIPILFEKIEHDKDMVIGSRFAPGGKSCDGACMVQWQGYFLKGLTYLVNYVFADGNVVTDATTGFRVIKRDVLKRLNPDQAGSCIDYQLTIRALKLHLKVTEVPTVKKGVATIKSIPDALKNLANCLHVFFLEIVNGYAFDTKRGAAEPEEVEENPEETEESMEEPLETATRS